jgi:hypothetical protein
MAAERTGPAVRGEEVSVGGQQACGGFRQALAVLTAVIVVVEGVRRHEIGRAGIRQTRQDEALKTMR